MTNGNDDERNTADIPSATPSNTRTRSLRAVTVKSGEAAQDAAAAPSPLRAMVATATIVAEPGEHFSLAHLLPEDEGADVLLPEGDGTNPPVAHLGRLHFRANVPGTRRVIIRTKLGRCEVRLLVTFLADILRNASATVLDAIDNLFANLDNPENWVALGNVIENKLEKPDRAAMAYMEAIIRGATSALVFGKVGIYWYNEYTLYSSNGNETPARTSAEQAKKWLERAIATDPNVAEPYYWLAMMFRDERRSGEEIAAWQSCLKLGPAPEQRREAQERLAALLPGVPACRACGIRGVAVHRHASLCDSCSESLFKKLDNSSPRGEDGRRGRTAATTHANPCSVCESRKFHCSFELHDIVVCNLCIDALAPSTTPDEQARWNIGDVIENLYEIKQIHSSGGMGWVYRAEHREWRVDLALKCIKRDLFKREADIANFENEAETWVNVGFHPHIVSCYYVRRIQGQPCIVAEYVEGGTLSDWIRDGRLYREEDTTPLARILDIAIQIAWGLHYAHERGIVHQDVKPANILMTPAGIARVADFGLARAHDALKDSSTPASSIATTVAGARIRTRAYASPEQVSRGSKLTRKTDLWSWACTLLEMFARGCCWYWGPRAEATLNRLLNTLDDPAKPLPIPSGVADLLRHCFREDPKKRPKSMQVVAKRLILLYGELVDAPYTRQLPTDAQLRADALNNRALSFLDLGNPSAAEAAWNEALQADPRHAKSAYNRGLLRWRSGKIKDDELAQTLKDSISLAAPLDMADLLLARIHLERNDSVAALQLLDVSKSPDRNEIARLSHDAIIRLPQSRRLLREIKVNSEHVALSRDGMFAVTTLERFKKPHVICLWDISTGLCIRKFIDEYEPDDFHRINNGFDIDDYAQTMISCTKSSIIKVWDLATGHCLQKFSVPGVRSVALSRDGQIIACGYDKSTISVFAARSGSLLRTFPEVIASSNNPDFKPEVAGIHITRDGSTVIACTYCGIVFLEATTGARIAVIESGSPVHVMSMSSDERYLAVGCATTIMLWDIASRKLLRELRTSDAEHDVGLAVSSVSVSADGTRILSIDTDYESPNRMRLWDMSTGRCLWSLHDTSADSANLRSACLVPDGRHAAVLGYDALGIWQLNPPTPHFVAPFVHSQPLGSDFVVTHATTSAMRLREARQAAEAGDAIAAARHVQAARTIPGYERAPAALQLWSSLYRRLPRGSLRGVWEAASFDERSSIRDLCLAPDGQHVIAVRGSGLVNYNLDNRKRQEFCNVDSSVLHISGIAVSRISGRIVCATRKYGAQEDPFVDVEVNYDSMSFGAELGASGSRIAISDDGRWHLHLIRSEGQRLLEIRDARTGQPLGVLIDPMKTQRNRSDDSRSAIESVWHSTDGVWVFTGHGYPDNLIRVWHVPSGRCVQRPGEWVDFYTGQRLQSHAMTHAPDDRIIPALSGNFDASLAVSGGYQDHLVKIWDTRTGVCRHALSGHAGPIASVAFTSDSRFVVSGGADRTIKIWDVETGSCVQTLAGHAHPVTAVCITPDTRFIVSGDDEGTVKFWFLDWELKEREPADWDEAALPFLKAFVSRCTPYLAEVAPDLTADQLRLAITRGGEPQWTDADLDDFMQTLTCAGFGWLSREGVRGKLDEFGRYGEGADYFVYNDNSGVDVTNSFESSTPSSFGASTEAADTVMPSDPSERRSADAQPANVVCSFCKIESDRRRIIDGPNCYICDGCAVRFRQSTAWRVEARQRSRQATSCSFCGADDCPLAEANAFAICDECLGLCHDIIEGREEAET